MHTIVFFLVGLWGVSSFCTCKFNSDKKYLNSHKFNQSNINVTEMMIIIVLFSSSSHPATMVALRSCMVIALLVLSCFLLFGTAEAGSFKYGSSPSARGRARRERSGRSYRRPSGRISEVFGNPLNFNPYDSPGANVFPSFPLGKRGFSG